jgi:hypothetical protein
MTSGDDAERSGGEPEPEPGPVDGSPEGCADEAVGDSTEDPVPAASAESPRERRRKAGVEYRPI